MTVYANSNACPLTVHLYDIYSKDKYAYYEIVSHSGYLSLPSHYIALLTPNGKALSGADKLILSEEKPESLLKQCMQVQMGRRPTTRRSTTTVNLKKLNVSTLKPSSIICIYEASKRSVF